MLKSVPVLLVLFASLLLGRAPAALPTPDPDDGGILLPPGFRALVVADNLVVGRKVGNTSERLRGIAVAPNGDIYAKGKSGGIFALRDTDGDGRADAIKEFGPGDGGTHIAFHDGWLYHSSRTAVYRYRYTAGELVPTSELQTVVSHLPAEQDHDAKAFAFDDQGRMLVEIGSPYNVYSTPDRQFGAKGMDATEFQKTYGGFWRFDPNKLNQTQADGVRFSTGHRHALALVWNPVSKNFFMVQMGRDNLNVVDPVHYDALDNAERVSEVMHVLREGSNFGWPYSYWDPFKKAHMVAPEFGGDNFKRVDPDPYDKPVVAFPAHWAPIQMTLYTGTQFPEKYRGGAFVAFHGSWNRAPRPQAGYQVAFVPFDGKGMPTGAYETFADGFAGKPEFVNTSDARFRPAGVAVGPDGSLYITDTEKGRIWRVIYTGEAGAATARRAASAPAANRATADEGSRGARLYQQVCAACHMPDGKGVSGMQPPLVGSAVVAGDPRTLIRTILNGPAQVLPADRPKYANLMPPMSAVMNDADIADTLTFIRRAFGKGAPPITAAQVAAERKTSGR
ncbi:MAG TPA: PQQ-dependent sugar dehydrogenase [Vicinamibacterales bacterium]|jgi:glucose/arabinose dehydrogenase/cytochrome c5|nr:PQQ-dependent sugar dehydrogenase [Vicinamibacterales bacterium]